MSENNLTAEEITAQRRIALYNIKAKNAGFNDFFNKDKQKEKKLEEERHKLLITLKHEKIEEVDELLMKPGETFGNRIKDKDTKQKYNPFRR
jgi:predicted lactoylglutathione lyase